jgi:Uma2 family endonuclease
MPDDEWHRYEVIDGDLHISSNGRLRHQIVCTRLAAVLGAWCDDTADGEAVSSPCLIFASDQGVIPDVVWLSSERLDLALGDDGHLHAAPDLVIEVLSPGAANQQRDRELKRKLYSRYGVQEYWIIDPRAGAIEVHRREQAALQVMATLAAQDDLTSPLLPGFRLALAALFRPLRRA